MNDVGFVRAGVLQVAFERSGPADGWPVVLLHGFPYDPRSYDEAADLLASAGADVVVPYLRGYGPTRFVSRDSMRSGQQAALAHDLHELIAALDLRQPVVAGYDWGGRAACLVAALWPDQIRALVTVDGYNVQDIAHSSEPARPGSEAAYWYQYYLHSERGRNGLTTYRREFAELLWRQWSPHWTFSSTEFGASAASFDNPDFVDVVVHSYRHRFGLIAGDPHYEATEQSIARQPVITVPTVIVDPTQDGLGPPESREEHERRFSRLVGHFLLDTGHNPAQEDPATFVRAVLAAKAATANHS